MTVPPSAVARIAPCSQPGTSTQTTVTSAGAAERRSTAAASATGSRASASATRVGQPGGGEQLAPRARRGTTPIGAAGAGVAGGGQATASRTCRRRRSRRPTARRPRSTYSATTRAASAGAPQTSMHHQRRGRGRGRRAARRRSSGRTGSACPSAGTCSRAAVPAASPSVITQRGEGQRDQGGDPVADRQARAATRGPTSSTVPTSMPPEPVTGFCILPRVGDDVEHLGAHAPSPSPAVLALGELAEGRGVEVERSTRDPHLVGPQLAARRRAAAAACGSTPAGSSTRCRPTGDDGSSGVDSTRDLSVCSGSLTRGESCGRQCVDSAARLCPVSLPRS